MNGRSMITMVLAVMIGLGAMILTRRMLSAPAQKQEETQELLVAARDFKEEERLKPEMVTVVRMVKSAVPPGSFSSFKDIEDRWVKTTMLEGDILIEKKLGPKGSPPGLVANIPKGMRAFALEVTEQSGVSGFILPGHHVDVIRFEGSEKGDLRGETILQNVLVLAAGQVFTRPDEKSVQTRTVTLALSPEDVNTLAAARAKGTISLSLRGVNDHDVLARTKPKPPSDSDKEKALREQRLKLEQEKRSKLERELEELKQRFARKAAEPPAPRPPDAPKIATIYRGINNPQRVLVDHAAVSELTTSLDSAAAREGASASGSFGASPRRGLADGDETDL